MEIFSKPIILHIFTLFFIQISSQKSACPKYSCNTQRQSSECAYVKTGSTSNNVTLTPSCRKDEFCDAPLPPWQTLSNQLKDKSYTCNKIKNPRTVRYPGEDCENDDYCIQSGHFTSFCKNRKCTGLDEGLSCFETFECMKGLYCDKDSRTCAKQKLYGASCSNSSQCENKYLCHEGKCSLKPFSADSVQL
jgi:hypothetical protein